MTRNGWRAIWHVRWNFFEHLFAEVGDDGSFARVGVKLLEQLHVGETQADTGNLTQNLGWPGLVNRLIVDHSEFAGPDKLDGGLLGWYHVKGC